ncbi:MAG: 5-(carboxyamino)imidazole ribonucleotide synthase [Rhodoferax sp.]
MTPTEASAPHATAQVLRPGSLGADGKAITLGVMGGGQLGRMFVQAAQAMGYYTAVLDPDPISPAGRVSHYHVQADYLDQAGLAQMLQRCAAITTEFENVPAAALLTLGAARPTAPAAEAVAIAQDRLREKVHLQRSGVAVAPYAAIAKADDLARVPTSLVPGILKTARLGYDGKGQVLVNQPSELAAAWQSLGQVPCVLEQRLPLAQECSVIVARSWNGDCVALPVQRNLHRNGVLAVTEVFEQNVAPELAEKAVTATKKIAQELHYVGVLCVEFFILQPDSAAARALGPLVANEMAPRPHNSGHYSIDACDVSQFELQVRTLAGLPLVQPRQHSAAVMLNLLGDLWHPDGSAPDWCSVLALPGAHLHLYGKLQARPGRKMGHLTLTAPSPELARAHALQAAQMLGLPAF